MRVYNYKIYYCIPTGIGCIKKIVFCLVVCTVSKKTHVNLKDLHGMASRYNSHQMRSSLAVIT